MIAHCFASLSTALYASPGIALLAAFGWGILSVLLSPCHLASIPLVLGYLGGRKDISTASAFRLSAFFTLGILIMMAAIGGITSLLGRMLGDMGTWVEPVMGGVFILASLVMAEIITLPAVLSTPIQGKAGKGAGAALLLGFLLGIALGPCSFAFMAPILGIVFGAAGSRLFFAMGLVLAYILGHCLVIILAGTFGGAVQSYLKWTQKHRGARLFRLICALLVFAAGLYLIMKRII